MRESSDRALRVAALVKRELAVLLRDKVRDPQAAGAVISDVEVSRDLSSAKVYLLAAEDSAQAPDYKDGRDTARVAALNRAAGFLRSALAGRLALRGVPKLRFLDDDVQRRSERLERLLTEERNRGTGRAVADVPDDALVNASNEDPPS